MNAPDPDQLADRIEKEIAGCFNAFVLIGPAEVAMCAEALRYYAVPYSKQPAAERPTLRTPDTARPIHPKLAEVLESYGCRLTVANKADE